MSCQPEHMCSTIVRVADDDERFQGRKDGPLMVVELTEDGEEFIYIRDSEWSAVETLLPKVVEMKVFTGGANFLSWARAKVAIDEAKR